MPRRTLVIGGVVTAVLAVGIPLLLVARALPGRSGFDLVATQSGEFPVLPATYEQQFPVTPVPLKPTGKGTQRLEVYTQSNFPDLSGVRLEVAVGTYTRAPSQSIHLLLLGPRRERLGSCHIPPSDYRDNGIITCPVERPEKLRRLVITVEGKAPLALYAAKEGKYLIAGALVRERRDSSLAARLGVLRDRLGVIRPAFFSPVALFVFLMLSIALLGAACLVVIRGEFGKSWGAE